MRKDTSSQVAKHGVCLYIYIYIYIYIRRDIEFEFIMVDCRNVVCIRLVKLGVFVLILYRSPSNSSEYNNHLSQFTFNFSVDREVILIGDFNLPSINWGNVHPFHGDFELVMDRL